MGNTFHSLLISHCRHIYYTLTVSRASFVGLQRCKIHTLMYERMLQIKVFVWHRPQNHRPNSNQDFFVRNCLVSSSLSFLSISLFSGRRNMINRTNERNGIVKPINYNQTENRFHNHLKSKTAKKNYEENLTLNFGWFGNEQHANILPL